MQQQLGLSALRLPSSLEELGTSPLFSAAAAAAPPDAAEVAAALQQARRQPLTALDWGLLFQALTSGQLQGSQPAQLVAVLSWAADSAQEQLEAAAAAGERPSGGSAAAAPAGTASDVGNLRLRQALQNMLKLSLLFLCSLARGGAAAGGEAQHPAAAGGKRGGKKAKGAGGGGEAAVEALAHLRVRRDALLAALSIEDALHDNRALLPAVSDLRAAGRLVRSAAMHCLVHLRPAGAAGGDRTAKELTEACFQAAAGILERTFVGAEARQAQAAAAQTLQDLLGVVAAPKQQAQVLAGAARLVGSVMHQSRRAGAAIVAALTSRIQQAAAAASRAGRDAVTAALAAQEVDACLHFAVLLTGIAGGGSGALQAALVLRLPQLLPLVRSPNSSTRRLMLDVCSGLLPSVAQLPFSLAAAAAAVAGPAAAPAANGAEPTATAAAEEAPPTPPADPRQAYRAALLAAEVGRLDDKDATLRAKALSCLEKHTSLVAAHLNAADCPSSRDGGGGPSGSSSGSDIFLWGLCGRLCDKSPSVRKKAVALLAALLQPAAGLSRLMAAALAGAVLPLAAQLLGVRPDSTLYLGEETLKVLSQAVLRMASASSSAAGLPHLLQLAASTTEPATRAQLQASVLDLLLPPSAGPPSADLLLHNLAAVAGQCSQQQLEQLQQAVQQVVDSSGGGVTAAVVRSAVRACYLQLHSLFGGGSSSAGQQAAGSSVGVAAEAGLAADGSNSAAEAEALLSAATALFVLGPFSGPPQADALAGLAEARLLLAGLQRVAQGGISEHNSAASRLLACTALAWQHLEPVCLLQSGSGSELTEESSEAVPAALALAQATLPALQALLLDPACSPSLRQAALQAMFALPPGAQAPLRLLRTLTAAAVAAAASDSAEAPGGGEGHRPAQPQQLLDADGELQLVAPDDITLRTTSSDAADDSPSGGNGSNGQAPDHTTSARQQQAQQGALVALLDLLGGLASSYEQQKAAFLQQLVTGAAQREQAQHAQQAAGQTSHFGRPLRPASEWWVGSGQPAGGAADQAGAARQGSAAAAADDYMRAEHLAAEHEAAAQRYLESLLKAADTAPACYLPLLEQLAGQAVDGPDEGEGATRLPAAVQAAALRALGRVALLSEPLSQRAVALAEAALESRSSSSTGGSNRAGTEVQAAAVALLADAIEAFPNRYSNRLLLIGRLMVPAAEPAATEEAAAGEEEPARGLAESSGAGSADAASELAASLQQEQQEQCDNQEPAQPAAVPTAAAAHHAPAAAALAPEQQEQLAQAAAAAYCRLLLRNKLKLQGMLGPLGSALASASPAVAALVQHALRQMLGAAAPKERARLCMALFHQTPPACRVALAQALVDPARGLLPAAELRGDVLVSQALQALLAAAQAGGVSGPSGRTQGGADGASLTAAATLLRAMQPSAKVLAALQTQLQAGGGGGDGGTGSTLLAKLPAAARQALRTFVSSHVPAATGRGEGERAAGADAAEGSAAGSKRKRTAGGAKGTSAAVQRQLLALLGGGGGGGGRGAATWRPPRTTATATTTGAPTAAGPSSAAPATSTRHSGQPASNSKEPTSSARPTRSRSARRSVRSRVLAEESDSEASG